MITASDGLEAMKLALSSAVDLVVTDAVMPHMSGRQLAQFFRNTPKLSGIPIVLLTGQENQRGSAEGENLIDVFLNKPVQAEELKNCLTKFLRR